MSALRAERARRGIATWRSRSTPPDIRHGRPGPSPRGFTGTPTSRRSSRARRRRSRWWSAAGRGNRPRGGGPNGGRGVGAGRRGAEAEDDRG
eukprot:1788978-Pyramimonas_sp.AAC.1